MEDFVVYILNSEKFNKNYTGFTSNLIQRLKSHNYLETTKYTLKFRPRIVIPVEFFIYKSEAMKREKYFKTGVERQFIQDLIVKLQRVGLISAAADIGSGLRRGGLLEKLQRNLELFSFKTFDKFVFF